MSPKTKKHNPSLSSLSLPKKETSQDSTMQQQTSYTSNTDSPHGIIAKNMVVSDEIANAFTQAQNRNEVAEVLKELFDKGKIYLITDLSRDEIKLMTRIYMIAEMKDIDIWKSGLYIYSQLMLSKGRKSRTELIEAIKGTNRERGIFSRLNPFNRQERGLY